MQHMDNDKLAELIVLRLITRPSTVKSVTGMVAATLKEFSADPGEGWEPVPSGTPLLESDEVWVGMQWHPYKDLREDNVPRKYWGAVRRKAADFHEGEPVTTLKPCKDPDGPQFREEYRELTPLEFPLPDDEVYYLGQWLRYDEAPVHYLRDPSSKSIRRRVDHHDKPAELPDPGEGYRTMRRGESLRQTDEAFVDGKWTSLYMVPDLGMLREGHYPLRRKIDVDRQPGPQ